MKAAYLNGPGGPDAFVYGDLPDPEPGPGEVVVRMHATTVNHVDTVVRSGIRPYFVITPPHILGHELAGDVTAVGAGVTSLKVGDRVTASSGGYNGKGSYAELVVTKAENTFRLPDDVSYEAASALGTTAGTAYRMVIRRAEAQAGQAIVITAGASGTGMMMVQVAKAAGCTVIATAGGEAKRKFAESVGADFTIDHYTEDVGARVLELTGGEGADAAVDAVSSQKMFDALTNGLRPGGKLVTYGNMGGTEVNINVRTLFSKGLEVRGGQGGHPAMLAAQRQLNMEAIMRLAAKGQLRTVAGLVLPLAEAGPAHAAMAAHEVAGKIVLTA